MKTRPGICDKHGESIFVGYKGSTPKCKRCSHDRITEQRRKNKILLVMYFGGKCTKCGYDKCITSLTFHHRDPEAKDFGLGNGSIRSFTKLLEEAKKCDLLCHNCHSEEHARPEDFNYKEIEVVTRKGRNIGC